MTSTTSPGPDVCTRVDAELVRRGLARSRAEAAQLVRDGAVDCAGVLVRKPATLVGPDAVLTVRAAEGNPGFVSRAGTKLNGVLDALGTQGPPVEGVDCLDIGASTGGFTDVLLRRGARSVIALDVGHDQLVPTLRADARVHVIEKFNARGLEAETLPHPPQLVVADVSFISLTMIIPAVARSVPAAADLLLMVKPQFEIGKDRLGSSGVVQGHQLRAEAVTTVVAAAVRSGLGVRAIVPSPLPGPHGNREFFVWFTRAAEPMSSEDGTIGRAVAHDLDTGTKAFWPRQSGQQLGTVQPTSNGDANLEPETLTAGGRQ